MRKLFLVLILCCPLLAQSPGAYHQLAQEWEEADGALEKQITHDLANFRMGHPNATKEAEEIYIASLRKKRSDLDAAYTQKALALIGDRQPLAPAHAALLSKAKQSGVRWNEGRILLETLEKKP